MDEDVLASSKFHSNRTMSLCTKRTYHSLAMVEMKTLLRKIYGQYRTTIAPEMKGDMSIHDQIIASRPKDQTCLLVFDRV